MLMGLLNSLSIALKTIRVCKFKIKKFRELLPFDHSFKILEAVYAVIAGNSPITRINLIYGYSWSVLSAIKASCKALEI